jgi:hypothetical protein
MHLASRWLLMLINDIDATHLLFQICGSAVALKKYTTN